MTEQELLSLGKHDRIRYVGTRTLAELFQVMDYGDGTLRPSFDTKYYSYPKKMDKGLVVYRVDKHSRSTSWKGSTIPEHITISFYSFGEVVADPAEWELVERRGYVEKETDYKRARYYIPQLIERFQDELKTFLEGFQNRADYKMNSLTADRKLKLIMELSPENKKWFGIITSNPAEAIKALEKSFEEEA